MGRSAAYARVRFAPTERNAQTGVYGTGITGAGPAPRRNRREGHMALVYNGFLTHGLLAAYQAAARLNACLSEAARRFSEFRWPFSTSDLPDREFRWPISTSDLPDSERRSGWSRQSASAHL